MRRRVLRAAALIVAVTSALAMVTYAPASSPPRRVGLVYAKATDLAGRGSSIWRTNADGSHARRLASGTSPQLSPDGRWIALVRVLRVSQRPLASDLLLLPAVGGAERLLQHLDGEYLDVPVWAPDSRHLVSSHSGLAKIGGLTLIDALAGTRTLFAPGRRVNAFSSPSFSPDSRQIVYGRSDQSGGDLYVYDSGSRKTTKITHDHTDFNPTWGPKWIAYNHRGYIRGGDIWVIRADGTGRRRLTHTNDAIYPAAWSRDGRRLLAANPATHNGRLWAVEVPSGHSRALTRWVGDLFPQGLSRDGTIVLAAIGCGGTASPYGVIETLPFAGGKPQVIAKGPCRASWNR